MTNTTHLEIAQLGDGGAGGETVFNTALNVLDALIFLSVINRTTTAPPGSPAHGDRYLIANSATGAWSGHDQKIAAYLNGWVIKTPKEGWVARVADEDILLYHDGSNWSTNPPSVNGDLTLLASLHVSKASGLTASTTQTQGQLPLTKTFNHISVCANANDVATLPAAADGKVCAVVNRGAQTLQIFPASGDKIDGGAADASITVASNAKKLLIAIDGTDWFSIV